MTRLELEAFLAIVKYGSISQAADRLFVTQPALSRRIKAVEQELGYVLFERGRGLRNIQLTENGQSFVQVAERLLQLYREAEELPGRNHRPILRLSAVNSLSFYLIPGLVRKMMAEYGCSVVFQSGRSLDAYDYVGSGTVDIALVSDLLHSQKVVTFPAFRMPFVFASGSRWEGTEWVSPQMLNPRDQIRMPWNPEYDVWHSKWFAPEELPSLKADKMELLEEFLEEEKWAVVPLLVARRMRKQGIWICPLRDGPEDLTIYCLTAGSQKGELVKRFLRLLHEELKGIPGIQSFLGAAERAAAGQQEGTSDLPAGDVFRSQPAAGGQPGGGSR